jgi:hypothetical protein
MDISQADNPTPDGSPPSPGLERFVWEALVPRLIGKVKLSIIKTLLEERKPLPAARLQELAGLSDCSLELVRYHAKYLSRRVGVLDVVGEAPRPDGQGTEPTYYFPAPPKASPSPSSTTAA